MAKSPGPGRCVHCGKEVHVRTWDHVFPQSWYPEDSPPNIEKWKIPSCKVCNLEYSQIEEDLFITLALCIGRDAPNAKGMYEPIHGSAPDIAGKGVANPLATILSVAMMLRYSLDHIALADKIEAAVGRVLDKGLRTADIMAEACQEVGTVEMGDAVLAEL